MAHRKPSPAEARAFSRRLLAWYRKNRRDMPWRRDRDPYRVWISEIMLQQTTVATVTPHYERFMKTFPTVEALAGAPLDDVLAAWSGLGYYSRARNLHAAAGVIVARFGGRFPEDHAEALSLPGIGKYTAAAILSIAFEKQHAVVDGNVARVLSRWAAISGSPKSRDFERPVWALAGRLIDPDSPGDFNQAMMELGATVCTPRSPACPVCPVSGGCRALEMDRVAAFPEAMARPEPKNETRAFVVIESRGRILMRRREGARLMAGLWELPDLLVHETDGTRLITSRIGEWLQTEIHGGAGVPRLAGEARHSIMNRRIRAIVFTATAGGTARPRPGWRFIPRDEIAGLGTSSLVTKALKTVDRSREREGEAQCAVEL